MAPRNAAVMPRLDRGIQYAAASRFDHERLGVLDRPVKPGDDTCVRGEVITAQAASGRRRTAPRPACRRARFARRFPPACA
ncbi:hypothetical protein XH89_30370 [Bradyrhizobium sp. CCBAU 53340]|nr:hypothetical protein XH89_30370 [Bradyrhizobium sp. CCBAU 53340]